MIYTFSKEFTQFYLNAIECNNADDLDFVSSAEDECNVYDYLNNIAGMIGNRITENEKNVFDHPANWQSRKEAYASISNFFFKYVYTRYWNFNGNGFSMPPDLSEEYKAIFSSDECDISEAFRASQNEFLINAFKNKSDEFIKTLDIQVKQYVFVYCYEHGLNFGFF